MSDDNISQRHVFSKLRYIYGVKFDEDITLTVLCPDDWIKNATQSISRINLEILNIYTNLKHPSLYHSINPDNQDK